MIFIFFDSFKMPLVESETHPYLGNKSGKSVVTFCNKCCCICFGFWFVLFTYFDLISLHIQISFEKMFQEQITRKL